jgi:hypothetical protein
LLEGFKPLLKTRADALDAELSGYEFLAVLRATAPDPADVSALLAELIGQAQACGKPEALAMLRVLAAVGPPPVRPAATDAADRMVARGLKDRPWVADLGAPQVGECFGYADPLGAQEAMAISFSYGRRRHAVAALIDHDLGGGVKDCWLTDGPDRVRAEYQKAARREGLDFRDYQPGEARAIMEKALSKPPCPVAPDQIDDVHTYLDLLRQRVCLLPEGATTAPPEGAGPVRRRRASATSARTVHRVKVSLRGAKPPIWRRLEVPSGCTLQHLHRAIQLAFGWQDYHLWVFETPSGDYGPPDPELGHRSAATKKLQDVAPRAGDRIHYTYDFGDNWSHDILVEDVLDAEPGVAYPRCLAGRRAGPPEDCGGIWGYAELQDVLADPTHEDHHDRLEWLGLDSADEFKPAAFDADAVSESLSTMARIVIRT